MEHTKSQLSNLLKVLIVSFLIVLTYVSCDSFSSSPSQSEELDNLFKQYYESDEFNGSVLITHNGELIYKNGFGFANMEWNILNKPNTKHRLGSVTKQFTAMLIMQQVVDGKLDLHESISTYLPDYPREKGDSITTHQLLTHTSGIPNYTSFPEYQEENRNPCVHQEFIKGFQDKDLEFQAGDQFKYSNSGYFLLGVILEKISGKKYEQLLTEYIFSPLGMKNSGYDHHAKVLKNRATGYEKKGAEYINAEYIDMSVPYAAGSIYSTVEDLYIWDQALYDNKLLPEEYMDLYFKPYVSAFGGMQYAYGWIIGKEPIGNTGDSISVTSHPGGVNGFNTYISRSTSENSLIVLLNNTNAAPLGEITTAIRGILKGESYDNPQKSLSQEFIKVLESDGIEEAKTFFKANLNNKRMKLYENDVNYLGYELMKEDRIETAYEVFKLNMEAFPESFNVYDSYADCLVNLGRNEEAIENYKKSILLNPENQGGIDKLKELGVDITKLD